MSNQRFIPEFKDEAVRQIVDCRYSVAEVSERLGVSDHSLNKWVKAVKPDKTDGQAAALMSFTCCGGMQAGSNLESQKDNSN